MLRMVLLKFNAIMHMSSLNTIYAPQPPPRLGLNLQAWGSHPTSPAFVPGFQNPTPNFQLEQLLIFPDLSWDFQNKQRRQLLFFQVLAGPSKTKKSSWAFPNQSTHTHTSLHRDPSSLAPHDKTGPETEGSSLSKRIRLPGPPGSSARSAPPSAPPAASAAPGENHGSGAGTDKPRDLAPWFG